MRPKAFAFDHNEVMKILLDKLCTDGDLPAGRYAPELNILSTDGKNVRFTLTANPPKPE